MPLSKDFEQRVERIVAETNERIASCHERLPCPTCMARVGQRCRNVRSHMFDSAPVLKHPHKARWTQETPAR